MVRGGAESPYFNSSLDDAFFDWSSSLDDLVRLFRRLYVDVLISKLLLSSLLFLGDELDLSTLVLGLVL